MRIIFVTGGAGFIGSAFVRLVLDEQPDVSIVNYDALTYAGNPANLPEPGIGRHTFVNGNICDVDKLISSIPDGCEAIFNFAAETHVDRSIVSAERFLQTNIIGTQALIDAARERGIRRFIQVSTDEVFGGLPDDDMLFNDNSPMKPSSPYAASKAAAELLVRAAQHTFGFDAVITRSGNNYGPRQHPEKLIPLVITNALDDQAVPVYGDGLNTRDWIYVSDHCRGVWLAFEKGRSGEAYNFGGRNERTNISVINEILDAMGKPRGLAEFVTDRPGHDRRYAIDASKAEKELGWRPMVRWEEGLSKTIQWYRDNPDWLESVRESVSLQS